MAATTPQVAELRRSWARLQVVQDECAAAAAVLRQLQREAAAIAAVLAKLGAGRPR